jgi:hypothetical protein
MFFTYNQNNSGGSFDVDASQGVSHYVIIEADDNVHADSRAEEIGLYFDGCSSGCDCSCCGDRWYRSWSDGSDTPMIFGKPACGYTGGCFAPPNDPLVFVHYLDGHIESFPKQPEA